MKWFCPVPWKTTACKIDLRPGGQFLTRMERPDGTSFENEGCYLDVVKNERLTWTSALTSGFRPAAKISGPGISFTAALMLEPVGSGGTKYTALAIHGSEADRQIHAAMGFEEGVGHRTPAARGDGREMVATAPR